MHGDFLINVWKIACVVSGGNIDLDRLVTIFQGKIPEKGQPSFYPIFYLTSLGKRVRLSVEIYAETGEVRICEGARA